MTPLSLSMLGDFGEEMQQTSSRMDSVLKKLEKVSHMTSSEWTWKIHEAPQPKHHVTETMSVPVRSQAVVRHRGPGCRHGCGPHPLLGPLMSVTRMDPRRGGRTQVLPLPLEERSWWLLSETELLKLSAGPKVNNKLLNIFPKLNFHGKKNYLMTVENICLQTWRLTTKC